MLQSINKIHNVQNITRIYALSKRNVILRYKNSLVGFFWGFFKPLLYLLIFIVIFASQFPSVNNYILYATSGLIFWFFFSNVTNQAIGTIVGSAGLIKSLNIPVIFFPLSELIGELFNFFLTLIVFLTYTQIENHVLNPVVMSRTVRVNPLLVLVSILVGASIGSWIGGIFGALVAALLAIPAAGAIQVLIREAWQSTAAPPLILPAGISRPDDAGGLHDPDAARE